MEENREENKQADEEKVKKENEKLKDEKISDYGQVLLDNKRTKTKIQLLSIIGEIEGHENLGSQNKTTKYEHVLPQLAAIEDNEEVDGLLVLLNTVGGDVEAGLAIAEMIASISKPTVSLVLGGSHSIGVPLAVSTEYSFIVPTGTMTIHPVRMSGMVIGVTQTFVYLEQIQDRILHFVEGHSNISYDNLRDLMLDTKQLVKDVGTVLVGEEAVKKGIINEVGGMHAALTHLKHMIEERK
ncbi:putative endopeptidase Clp [Clostridium sp. CAG:411]|jgi:ATP-dependent protease ClpP protease subunit|nr:ATP-dependent Clp protease proteolytic subunit [Lachnospiraceae bacterium]CDE43381.1 putative endopeptidase Clp [Clostridium sp. CAG:411]